MTNEIKEYIDRMIKAENDIKRIKFSFNKLNEMVKNKEIEFKNIKSRKNFDGFVGMMNFILTGEFKIE